jgi:predicted PurR-regulated permease PerM
MKPVESVPPIRTSPPSVQRHPQAPHERSARIKSGALVVLALVAVGWAVSAARALFIPLAFALMLFFLLRPAVRWLAQRHVPRPIASALVLLSALGLLTFATVELAAPAVAWSQRLPDAVHQIEVKSRGWRYPVEHLTHALQTVTRLTEVGHSEAVPRVDVVKPGWLEGLLARAASITTQLGLTLVASFFLLIDGDALLGRVFRLGPSLPESRRASVVINEVGARMSAYLGTVTLVNLGLGTVLTGALFLAGMPNPWLWGGLAAVFTYVPYVGPAVGIGLVTLASFVAFPTAGRAVVAPIVYLCFSVLEGSFVTPLVLGRAFAVRPLVLFVWLALWAWLWSIPGAILAVPLLMLFKFVCDETPKLAGVAYLIRR